MGYFTQTDKTAPHGTNSTSGTVEPKYIFNDSPVLKENVSPTRPDDSGESVELTGEEEEKFYKKVMKTTLL